MNRGQARRRLFLDDRDASSMFELLFEVHERWGLHCHAACLLPNHYHLLLHDEYGNLSRAMRHIDGVYTQRFNRRYARDGPLMRGRYRSQLIVDESYLWEVVRYIHRNPIKHGLTRSAAVYPWSSHRLYLQPQAPLWLCRDLIFRHFGRTPSAMRRFDAFVHERDVGDGEGMLEIDKCGLILATAAVRRGLAMRVLERKDVDTREVPAARSQACVPVAAVVDAACVAWGCDRPALTRGGRGRSNIDRGLLLLACRRHTGETNASLGARFGIQRASVSAAVARARQMLGQDASVRRRYASLGRQLSENWQSAT
jgi:putative transposase